jgi:cystathionine beta-lyase/cystathionine gamma-synthase
MSTLSPAHVETLVAHADRGIDAVSDVAPPMHQTAPFRASSDDEFEQMSNTPRHNRNYTRDGNPTFTRVEAVLAALEGAEAALLTSSGMGAISTTVLALMGGGDHVIAQRMHYMGPAGAHYLLQVRAEILNGTLTDAYRVANPRFRGSSGFAQPVH